jgi:hypothetical protein
MYTILVRPRPNERSRQRLSISLALQRLDWPELHLKSQLVPHSKHTASELQEPIS